MNKTIREEGISEVRGAASATGNGGNFEEGGGLWGSYQQTADSPSHAFGSLQNGV
jgi:hypothetical protein